MKTRIHTNRGIRLLSLFLCLVMLTGLFCAAAPQAEAAGKAPVVPSLAAWLGRTEERDPYTVSRASFEERGLLYTAYTYGVKQAEEIKAYCESIGQNADFRLLGKITGSGTTFKTTYYYFDCADTGAVKPIRTDLFREIRSGEEAIRESVAGDDLPFDSFALCVSVSERPPQMTLVTFYYGDGVRFAGVNDAGTAGSSAGTASSGNAAKITGLVLPDPDTFFRGAVKFKTDDMKLNTYGMCKNAKLRCADMELLKEYLNCIEERYSFSVIATVYDPASQFNPQWDWYSDSVFFRYDGSEAVGNVSLRWYAADYVDISPVAVDIKVSPHDDEITFAMYYNDSIRFRDDGYRASGKPASVPVSSRKANVTCTTCHGTGHTDCPDCSGGYKHEFVRTSYGPNSDGYWDYVPCNHAGCSLGKIPCPYCS